MNAEKRREKIIKMLLASDTPITGKELANHFQVSRQVIVQDIALLRAQGEKVLATPQGYILHGLLGSRRQATIVCRHTRDQIEDELSLIVDLGGMVLDVIVEHPLYGELKGVLMIGNRRDLALFMQKLRKTNAQPLSVLTFGIHLHTIEAPDDETLNNIKMALQKAGFLIG